MISAIAVSISGCYHATVETGRPASADKISQPWAMSFVYGLIPPATVQTASRCPNGVAKVETQQSFLNGLVSALTFGIITPMQIDVTCASGAGSDDRDGLQLSAGSDPAAALANAAGLSAERQQPVFVRF
ncbi:MAG TPA: Bor family protein [Gemmatimonadaceae bacterium]